jgi:hypothetical protein
VASAASGVSPRGHCHESVRIVSAAASLPAAGRQCLSHAVLGRLGPLEGRIVIMCVIDVGRNRLAPPSHDSCLMIVLGWGRLKPLEIGTDMSAKGPGNCLARLVVRPLRLRVWYCFCAHRLLQDQYLACNLQLPVFARRCGD